MVIWFTKKLRGQQVSTALHLRFFQLWMFITLLQREISALIQADFNAMSFSAGLNTTIRLFGNPVLQFIGEYNGKSVTQQGTIGSFYSLSVSLKQEFFKKADMHRPLS